MFVVVVCLFCLFVCFVCCCFLNLLYVVVFCCCCFFGGLGFLFCMLIVNLVCYKVREYNFQVISEISFIH